MRGMTRTGTVGPERSHERGVALTMVALSMVAILGIASLVIDIGSGYRTRRALIPATDAAALAAAQTYVAGGNGCAGTAGTYLTANEPTATMTGCSLTGTGSRGRVAVTASNNVTTWFAPVIGKGDYTVSSASTVQWGPPAAVTGLRPIGLCLSGNPQIQNLVLNPPAVGSPPVDVVLSYTKAQPTACGTIPGNWGTVDLNGTLANTKDLSTLIREGFPDPVNVGNDGPVVCTTSEPHCYPADTGALPGASAAFTDLMNSGAWFTVPVFDSATGNGSSPTTLYHLMGVLRVQLLDFDLTGSNGKGKGKGNVPFLELNVQPGLITGTCCGTGSGSGNNRVMAICAVDPNATGSCSA